MAPPKKPVPLEPIPAKYRQLGEPLAREMMASDKRNLLGSPAAKKAMSAGTVIDTGKGLGVQKDINAPAAYVSPADKRRFSDQLRIVAERKRRLK